MRAPDATPVAAAVGFLTRLPVGGRAAPDALLRGAVAFPLVGAAIGAAVGGAAALSAEVLPPLLAGAIALAVELVLTGALHADGLADSADGLAGRDRDHALAIMRDHALGSYGGAALTLVLLAKAAALGALADEGAAVLVVAAFALSRAAPLALAAALPYARTGAGTGRLLADRAGAWRATAAAVLSAAIAAAVAGLAALPLIAAAAIVTATIGLAAHRRLAGVTGDIMGASIELSATATLVLAVALPT